MKKSNILIVAFAVIIAAASVVSAKMADVNFDQRLLQTERSKAFTRIGTVENDLPAIPLSIAASNTDSTLFRKLDSAGLQRLRKEIFNIPGLPKEFLQAVSTKKITVYYNNYGISLINQVGENAYAMLWESNKWLLEFLINQEATVIQAGIQDKKAKLPLMKGVGDNIPSDGPGGFGGPYGGGGGSGGGGSCEGASSGSVMESCSPPY